MQTDGHNFGRQVNLPRHFSVCRTAGQTTKEIDPQERSVRFFDNKKCRGSVPCG